MEGTCGLSEAVLCGLEDCDLTVKLGRGEIFGTINLAFLPTF
jgi:hypothetical protein